MPMIEVDENAFHSNQRLVGLVQRMLGNPEARKRVLEAHKIVDPKVVIPEIDARKPVEDAVSTVNKRLDDFIAAQTARDAKQAENSQREQFITKFQKGREFLYDQGVTEEGLKAVEDLMAKEGIVNHEVGWAAFSKLNPEPTPAPPTPNFGFGGIFGDQTKNPDEFLKAMHASRGNDEAALDRRIHEVLVETRQQNGTQARQSRR